MSAQPPAGWYADPDAHGQQRYWDGQGWTDHVVRVLFDAELPILLGLTGVKERLRLTVTDAGFQWRGGAVGWDQIVGFSHLITRLEKSRANLHTFDVWREGDVTRVGWQGPLGKGPDADAADAAQRILGGALAQVVAPRLLANALDQVARGGEVVFRERVDKRDLAIAATSRGIEVRGRKATSIPWSQYAGVTTPPLLGFTQVHASTGRKPKPIAQIHPMNFNVPLMAPLFDELAARWSDA